MLLPSSSVDHSSSRTVKANELLLISPLFIDTPKSFAYESSGSKSNSYLNPLSSADNFNVPDVFLARIRFGS
jgi:hypothetical protein